MSGPVLALRAGLVARLADDPALAALMGGRVQLYDEPPRGTRPVYALFGDAGARDDSTDGAVRHVHAAQIVVIGRPGSTRSALEAAERIAVLLADLPPELDGHALVRLRVTRVDAARDARTGESRAVLTLEAVTEAAP